MARPYLENDAILSACERYRYLLRRAWDHGRPRALLVMLNPSTADAAKDDATIRSCRRLLTALGYGSMEVVNLFAWRATDPDELASVADPVGVRNDGVIESAISRCDIAICAWGAHRMTWSLGRRDVVIGAIRAQRPAVFCFGKTKSGAPKHPLYIKTGTQLETYRNN